MRIRDFRIIGSSILVTLLVMCMAACSKKGADLKQEGPISTKTYVAVIDGEPAMTLGEVLDQLTVLSNPGSGKDATPENAYLEVLYRKLAMIEAKDYDDFDPKEIHRLTKNRLHDVLMQYLYQDRIASKTQISDAQIESVYNTNLKTYTQVERRCVTHLLMSDNPKAWEAAGEIVTGMGPEQLQEKARTMANKLYAEIQGGANIADVAAKYSHDSNSKARRGNSGWFTRPEMVDEFSNVAFGLSVGKISKPFKSTYGWHILRVDSIAPEQIQPLDSALRENIVLEIRQQIESRRGQEFVDSIFQASEFTFNEPLLEKEVGDYDPYDWICIVNNTDTIDAIVLRESEMMYRTRQRVSTVEPEIRKDLVRSQATPWVLTSAARKLGITELDTMKSAYQTFRRAEIVNRIFRNRVPGDLKWADEELEAYYKAHQEEFNAAKPINVQHIVFEDSLKALEALHEIQGGADFKDMAMKYYPGEKDFKEAAFDLGWIGRDDISSDFYDRAWITQAGQVSGPVKTQWGYHLLKVIDRKSQFDFQSAKNEVRRKMREEAYAKQESEFIAGLMKGHDIVRLEDIWKQVNFGQPEQYYQVADSLQRAQAASAPVGN